MIMFFPLILCLALVVKLSYGFQLQSHIRRPEQLVVIGQRQVFDREKHLVAVAPGNGDQDSCPLIEALSLTSQSVGTPLFFPGHKMGRGAPARLLTLLRDRLMDGRPALAHDLPELPALDNLFAPEGPIKEAENLAAELFGAQKTWFLINGSTAGVIASILACVKRHQQHLGSQQNQKSYIILPRNIHRSALHGLVVSGAAPLWLEPARDPGRDLALGCRWTDAEAFLNKYGNEVAAVVLVSPTYHGVMSDVGSASAALAARRAAGGWAPPLIVDEAHGAHLSFLPSPAGALLAGADLVVQSTHKALTSFTQSAMLHLGPGTVFGDLEHSMMEALELTQSSSPNYLLLASLDAARWQFGAPRGEGRRRLAAAAEAAGALWAGLRAAGFDVLEPPTGEAAEEEGGSAAGGCFTALDPLKVTCFFQGSALDGYAIDEMLIEEGIYCELPSPGSITFAFGPGSDADDTARVLTVMRYIHGKCFFDEKDNNRNTETSVSAPLPVQDLQVSDQEGSMSVTLHAPVSPREAFFSPSEMVPSSLAVGRLSAESICPYPPGIPVLLPGEPITLECIQSLQECMSCGGTITGCTDSTLNTFKVLTVHKENKSPSSSKKM